MQVNLSQLADYEKRGLITRRVHPSGKLYIFNYTPECQYAKAWDDTTLMCRGLITDTDGNVIAHPFNKFFNHGEQDIKTFAPIHSITEKLDGSLGIMYELDGEYAIATRGSFTSTQAVKGTEMLRMMMEANSSRYYTPTPGVTYLFEIIYPENRIVVDYGKGESLMLIATLSTANGEDYDDTSRFARMFSKPRKYLGTSIADIQSAPEIPNAEGYVVLFDDGLRIKFKFDEYMRLHRILTETSTTVVWEILAVEGLAYAYDQYTPKQIHDRLRDMDARLVPKIMAKKGKAMQSLMENVPDEFYDWLRELTHKLKQTVVERIDDSSSVAELATDKRHAIALCGDDTQLRAMVLARMDGKYDSEFALAWRYAKPAYSKPFAKDDA